MKYFRPALPLTVAVLLITSCANKTVKSPVLTGTIGTDPATATCPWASIERIALERDAVIVNGVYYGVGSDGPAAGFEHLLALCELDHAIGSFRAWRAIVPAVDARKQSKQTADIIGTYALLVAVSAVASAADQHLSGPGEFGTTPLETGPVLQQPDGVEIDAAAAFLTALADTPP